jgi:hypothetical protein
MKNLYKIQDELYIIDNNEKVNQNGIWAKCSFTGDILKNRNGQYAYKVILTTNNLLIEDGVQSIDDTFLEWFVKNPSCEYVEIKLEPRYGMYRTFEEDIDVPPYYGNLKRKIIIPQEETKQICENCKQAISKYGCACGKQEEPKQEPLNLEKLESKLDNALSKETKESLTDWLNSKRDKQEIDEEAAILNCQSITHPYCDREKLMFIKGAKWQQEQDRWKTVYEETPPIHVELLVKSPEGIVYLANWRESYNIFTCQTKSESSCDWKWKTI